MVVAYGGDVCFFCCSGYFFAAFCEGLVFSGVRRVSPSFWG